MTGTTPTVGTPNAPPFPTTTGTGTGTTGPGIPDMSGMNMEHALDTLYVPPLVDDRVFSRLRRAVQAHAGSLQRLDEANAKLRDLRDTLQNLCDVASVCRLAARGEPRAFCRAHDELECIAIDFPDNPLGPAESGMGVAAPNDNWQLAAALDLFAGAAFVSKGDTAQLTRYVTAIVRAIEMAVAFPLAFADESACFLGESAGAMPPALARRAIANATRRLLSNDTDCTPAAPARFTARLETLARRWIKANPVTALFDALTGPTLDETAITLRPSSGSAGGVLTLSLGMQSVDPASLVAMFTPHVPANIVRTQKGTGELYVVIPAGAHSGHVAVVQRRGADQFTQVNALVQNYEADFEAEWMLGVFSFIPLQEWCYPIAFTDSPWIHVTQVPASANVQVFDADGRRAESRNVKVNEPVTVTCSVYPPGSEANAPLAISATNGTIAARSKSNTYVYRPGNRGTGQIRLTWGGLTVTANVTAGD